MRIRTALATVALAASMALAGAATAFADDGPGDASVSEIANEVNSEVTFHNDLSDLAE
ncbi:hypothetical protein GCM10010277_85680 [Streptomyces longisporoflavus]|uniref:hypothetical protein n=1 Tax=Streptomyces longisporoflavus TaxID=28044 RepID=UPI00167E90E3|nr:hypothetical protein [Streptomyces longisporoflavus]GGV72601.1 hypothetical protein GCM10010277_85680 [Streptomyces longisporoflavus]